MTQGKRAALSATQRSDIWCRWKAGHSLHEIGRAFGQGNSSIHLLLSHHGGIVPAARRRSLLALTLKEREEISRGIASGSSIREIAKRLDRAASTVSREVARHGGRPVYRANEAVNAGNNAPILFSSGSTTFLESTGPPLGLFLDAEYETRTAVISPDDTLLIFTDGLSDSIQGEHPEDRWRDAFAESAGRTMANLKSLVDPKFNEDDVTILLVKRIAGSASSGVSA